LEASQLPVALEAIAPLLAAVAELRAQVDVQKPLGEHQKYPGRRAGVDPHKFLIDEYGEAIESGTLGPGLLSRLDNNLYFALRRDIDRKSGGTMQKLFGELHHGDVSGDTRYQRRANACATLLGIPADKAANFFGTLRSTRLSRSSDDEPAGRT
jgi:hypothetical protein